MDFLVISLILLGLALLGAIMLVFVKMKKTKTDETKEINYKAFFAIGITYMGAGTALTATINPGFLGITALGLIYILISLKNRDKWTSPEKKT
jgi:tellurite resistance protein TehA-like permease